MPDLAKIEAVAAKLAESEPAPENTGAASPPDGVSEAGSAPAEAGSAGDATAPEATPPAGASIDHGALRAKLEADRARREEKARRKRLEEEESAIKKAREEAEAEKAKWAGLGKGKTFLETIKELGHDPLKTFEEMKTEALKAGTPEAKLEAMERAWQARVDALETKLTDFQKEREEERQTAEEERKQYESERSHQAFVSDFQRGVGEERFAPLVDEYEPADLFRIVSALKENPPHLFEQAQNLGVELTSADGSFTMIDILNVCLKTQQRHQARLEEQRRKKSAAPQTSPAGPKQPPAATKPTVNGTAERNAETSLGNQLAATRAADASPRKESREQRLARLASKYG